MRIRLYIVQESGELQDLRSEYESPIRDMEYQNMR